MFNIIFFFKLNFATSLGLIFFYLIFLVLSFNHLWPYLLYFWFSQLYRITLLLYLEKRAFNVFKVSLKISIDSVHFPWVYIVRNGDLAVLTILETMGRLCIYIKIQVIWVLWREEVRTWVHNKLECSNKNYVIKK